MKKHWATVVLLMVCSVLNGAEVFLDSQACPVKSAQWIRAETTVKEPFQFVGFRKCFELGTSPEKAMAYVTADTFYRLWVNGKMVMHGPARSSVGKATIDPVDIGALLHAGHNTAEAEVLYYDGRFEALGQAQGFLCELQLSDRNGQQMGVATDATWEAREISAWSRQSSKFSFQRTFVEDIDARLNDNPVWTHAVVVGPVGTEPWRKVSLRNVPLPDPNRIIPPVSVLGVQRGDGCIGDMKGTPELEDMRYGPIADWCGKLQTEGIKSDPAAVENAKGVTKADGGDVLFKGDGASVVYDMGANHVGFIAFEVTGKAGEVLEVVWNESLSPDGQTVRPIQGINATQAMRYVLRDGRQTYISFNPYLAKYLRVVHRGAGEVKLHRLWMVDHSFALPVTGSFECSDDGLNRIYQSAVRTAKLNTLDTFMDNPCRERGSWFREGYWMAQSVYMAFGDLGVSRRMVRYGADSQHAVDHVGPDGMIQMLYPSTLGQRTFIPAHALYWVLQAGLHERIAGDEAFVREMLPAVRRLMTAFETWRNEEGLLEKVPSWNFLDWAQIRDGDVSIGLNAMYARTLDEVALLEETTGAPAFAVKCRKEASQVRRSINRYCDGNLFYPDGLVRNANKQLVPNGAKCEATQYFVLWGKVPDKDRTQRMWNALRDDFQPTPGSEKPINGMTRGGLYCFFERLQVAAQFNDCGRMVRDIKLMFQHMADSSPGTLWEHTQRKWCLCQGFSSGVAAILTEEILGVRLTSSLRIEPHCGGLQWCKGQVKTVHGLVEVSWKLEKDRYKLKVRVPEQQIAEVILPSEAERIWEGREGADAWPSLLKITGCKSIVVKKGRIDCK